MTEQMVVRDEPSGVVGARFGDEWWQHGVVYQIYPRSFADSDGDGVGDLPGIIAKLDYLRDLGVDALWLSPIYPSPGRDVGYDVSDHTAVDPLFGGDADFDRLVAEAHRRGLRVVLDLVMNHTSDQHPWFQASRSSRDNEYADWYLWRDPAGLDSAGKPIPPNNWLSWFGGSAWQWDEPRQQFYMHTFLVEQPELNWRNPAGRGGPVRHGPRLAGARRGRVPARRLQRLPQAPGAAGEPGGRGRHALGAPAAPLRPRSA